MSLPSKNAWAGQGAVLIGGGASLKALDWPTLSLWLEKTGCRSIVVNRAFKELPGADMWFSEDWRTVKLWGATKQWNAFRGLKVLHALETSFAQEALKFDNQLDLVYRPPSRPMGDKWWSDDFSDGLSLSSNSMIGALNIADILGANPIYLLGVDCNQGVEDTHYHNDYVEEHGKDRSWGLTTRHQMVSFASDFKHWAAPNLKRKGRHVFNLNPSSAVDCWPRLNWNEVIQ